MPNFAMPVRLYMSAPVRTLRPDDSLTRAKEALVAHHVSSLPVVDADGALIGLVSRSDLLQVGRREAGSRPDASLLSLPAKPVIDIMTTEVVTVEPEAAVSAAAAKMLDSRVHRVVVVDDGVPCGVLSPRDIMTAIADKRLNVPMANFMSAPVFTVRASEPLSLATDRLAKARVSGLIVTDGDWPVGAFTQLEALRFKDEPRTTPVEAAMSSAILQLDERTPLYRAAAQAAVMEVKRVAATAGTRLTGILSGLDFARAAL